MQEVKQYIIVRTDLPMNAGKVAAQAAHACIKVFFDKMKFLEKTSVTPFYPGTSDEEGIVGDYFFKVTREEQQWIEGMFTKITKKVKNENQLLKVYNQAKEAGLNVSLIKDAGLYGLEGENYTCVAVGPNYVDRCEPVVGKLQLLTDLKNHETNK
jgi:PTH2 family peptidyl-tRNA hydrolase